MSDQISDKLTASILRLQASAIECFNAINDRNALPTKEGDVDYIAQQFMRLANIEGAIITLQQYLPDMRAHKASLIAKQQEKTPLSEPEPTENSKEKTTEKSISSEELEKRSPAFRASQKGRKKSTSKTKPNES